MITSAANNGMTEESESLRRKLFIANQYAIVETLDSPDNAIYQQTATDTYCNIYAYDVVTALGGYLPRLWWTDSMESKIQNGEINESEIAIKYDGGVTKEMRANMLNDWMSKHGESFGWVKAASMEAAQSAANDGNIVIILASNKKDTKPGHVNVILAETDQHQSETLSDGSYLPLQSQAGGVNFKYSTYAENPKWWENSTHKNGAAWICMGKPNSPLLSPEEVGLAPAIDKSLVDEPIGTDVPKVDNETATIPSSESKEKTNKETESSETKKFEGGYSEENAVLSTMVTSGAGVSVTHQDGDKYDDVGIPASERMAKKDFSLIQKYVGIFVEVGKEKSLPPALLAAICSRESRGGAALDATGHGDHGHGFGLMQIDDRSHDARGAWDSKEHVSQAADILKVSLEKVQAKFPDWSAAQQLRGAVAAYNFGVKNLQTIGGMDKGTTGGDYSADTWARARYFAGLKEFGGQGQLQDVALPGLDSQPEQNGPVKRSGVPKGRLISQSVGRAAVNHDDDVNAVLNRLVELQVISTVEALDHSPEAITLYVLRYQSMIFSQPGDGVITPGKTTETKLIQGVKTKSPSVDGKSKEKKDKSPQREDSPKKTGASKGTDPKAGGISSKQPDYVSIAHSVHAAMFDGFGRIFRNRRGAS